MSQPTDVLEGGCAEAFAFINALRRFNRFKSTVSLGGSESLVRNPASTTHSGVSAAQREADGVSEGLVRLSTGLEHVDDLQTDLDRALCGLAQD